MSKRQRKLDSAAHYESAGNHSMAALLRERVKMWDAVPGAWAHMDMADAHPRADGAEICECDAETRVCSCAPFTRSGVTKMDSNILRDGESLEDCLRRTRSSVSDVERLDAQLQRIEAQFEAREQALRRVRVDVGDPRAEMIARNKRLAFESSSPTVEKIDAAEYTGSDPLLARQAMIARNRRAAATPPSSSATVAPARKLDAAPTNDPRSAREEMIAARRRMAGGAP